jgi:hypothetical protein
MGQHSMNFQSRRSSQPMATPPPTLKNRQKSTKPPNPACLVFLESLQPKESTHQI